MPILIDGHNLIGQLSSISLGDPDDEEVLVRLLRAYRARSGKAVTVIFDPGDRSALATRCRSGGVEVVFAAPGLTADMVIKHRVNKSANPQSIVVVTSDRILAEAVAGIGARVQDAREFGALLEGSAGDSSAEETPAWKEQRLSPEEVEAWLSMFEGDDGDAD
ncbi:MAG: NYN domain-containing protein [Anaerolineae bacterium]|nr:NYN domain-containing protein [Anaerolineae bacterium]